jgi:hypothetical protein
MQGGRAKKCKVVEHKFFKKCKVVEQKKARWSSKTMQDGGAEVKQKMQDGRAKKCKAVEQKLNKKMQDGRAKKCKID